jgi:AraC family transcriptional regulator
MGETHLRIKNMVCNRCIRVVGEELQKLGLHPGKVELGEAVIEEDISAEKLQQVREVLEQNGFELLEDHKAKLVEQIKNIIIKLVHQTDASEITVNYSDYISGKLKKDYHYLTGLFSSIENVTIEKYIIQQKIERVKELLVYGELTLSEIAYRLGYSSVAHLSNQFRQVTGFSPTEYKKIKSHKRKPLDEV